MRAVLLALAALLAGPAGASAAVLVLVAAPVSVFVYEVSIEPIAAVVDLKPETLEWRGTGVPVTGFIELGDRRDVASIDRSSVRLCLGLDPCADGVPISGKPKLGDADGDGIRDLKVAFDRSAVAALVAGLVLPVDVTFAVSGLVGPDHFVGRDVVRLVP
jgi:hypothetical protein